MNEHFWSLLHCSGYYLHLGSGKAGWEVAKQAEMRRAKRSMWNNSP